MKIQQVLRRITSGLPQTEVYYGGPMQDGEQPSICVFVDPTSVYDLWYNITEVLRHNSKQPLILMSSSSDAVMEDVIMPVLWLLKEYVPGILIDRHPVEDGKISVVAGITASPYIPDMAHLKNIIDGFDRKSIIGDIIDRYPLLPIADSLKLWRKLSTRGVDDKVDIVFTLGDAPSADNNRDFRLSLRSIDKNAYDIGRIWCVTMNPPDWLTNVEVIRGADIYDNNKDGNLIHKLLKACDIPELSDRFIFWSDDQILNREFPVNRHVPVFNPRPINVFERKLNINKWSDRMHNTLKVVESMGGISTVNWDSHVPQPIDKDLFKDLLTRMPFRSQPGLCVNTAYFGAKYEYPRISQVGIKSTYEDITPVKELPETLFLGYNDAGKSSGLMPLLEAKFEGVSKYEKNT